MVFRSSEDSLRTKSQNYEYTLRTNSQNCEDRSGTKSQHYCDSAMRGELAYEHLRFGEDCRHGTSSSNRQGLIGMVGQKGQANVLVWVWRELPRGRLNTCQSIVYFQAAWSIKLQEVSTVRR